MIKIIIAEIPRIWNRRREEESCAELTFFTGFYPIKWVVSSISQLLWGFLPLNSKTLTLAGFALSWPCFHFASTNEPADWVLMPCSLCVSPYLPPTTQCRAEGQQFPSEGWEGKIRFISTLKPLSMARIPCPPPSASVSLHVWDG